MFRKRGTFMASPGPSPAFINLQLAANAMGGHWRFAASPSFFSRSAAGTSLFSKRTARRLGFHEVPGEEHLGGLGNAISGIEQVLPSGNRPIGEGTMNRAFSEPTRISQRRPVEARPRRPVTWRGGFSSAGAQDDSWMFRKPRRNPPRPGFSLSFSADILPTSAPAQKDFRTGDTRTRTCHPGPLPGGLGRTPLHLHVEAFIRSRGSCQKTDSFFFFEQQGLKGIVLSFFLKRSQNPPSPFRKGGLGAFTLTSYTSSPTVGDS